MGPVILCLQIITNALCAQLVCLAHGHNMDLQGLQCGWNRDMLVQYWSQVRLKVGEAPTLRSGAKQFLMGKSHVLNCCYYTSAKVFTSNRSGCGSGSAPRLPLGSKTGKYTNPCPLLLSRLVVATKNQCARLLGIREVPGCTFIILPIWLTSDFANSRWGSKLDSTLYYFRLQVEDDRMAWLNIPPYLKQKWNALSTNIAN